MGAAAFGLALLCLCMFEYDLLTSPDRTGSEGLLMWITASIALVLAVGLSRSMSLPYRNNKDDADGED
jgi:hypothetical protein